jgi:uncharacterized protein (DUF433 family)
MEPLITVYSSILGGKPIIRGTRITVDFILELLTAGVTQEEILADYPHVPSESIAACLVYAAHALKNEVYLDLKAA